MPTTILVFSPGRLGFHVTSLQESIFWFGLSYHLFIAGGGKQLRTVQEIINAFVPSIH